MRSFLLFMCCFASVAGAIYFGLQGALQTTNTPLQAAPIAVSVVDVPIVTRKVLAGDILYPNEILWLPAQMVQANDGLLSQADYRNRAPAYIAISAALDDGELLPQNAVVWPDDPHFIQSVLQSGHQAIELNGRDFTAPSSFDFQVGTRIDLFLERLKEKAMGSVDETKLPLLIAQSLRILKIKRQNQSDLSVFVDGNENQIKAVMKARTLGTFSIVIKNRVHPLESLDLPKTAISFLTEIQVNKNIKIAKPQTKTVLIQRGTNREYVTFGATESATELKKIVHQDREVQ